MIPKEKYHAPLSETTFLKYMDCERKKALFLLDVH